jgi:hypothetical protein
MVPVLEEDRKGFRHHSPFDRSEHDFMSWKEWAEYHKALGQELAKRMREYGGPAEQDEPPPGGTPVAMRMAA